MSPDWADKPEDVPYAKLEDPQSLNLYAYVGNNPLGRSDPDGHNGITDALKVGAALEIAAPELTPAIVIGVGVVAIGTVIADHWDSIKESFPSTGTGVGPYVGPNRETVALLNKNASSSPQPSNIGPKKGESGGPGAGKAIPDKTKAAALEENKAANGGQAKCVFCGESVGPGTKNKINYDHGQPKADDGTSGLKNTNVTCEYCNKSKGTGTAPKNPKQPNQN